jgi:hypothetical protein
MCCDLAIDPVPQFAVDLQVDRGIQKSKRYRKVQSENEKEKSDKKVLKELEE